MWIRTNELSSKYCLISDDFTFAIPGYLITKLTTQLYWNEWYRPMCRPRLAEFAAWSSISKYVFPFPTWTVSAKGEHNGRILPQPLLLECKSAANKLPKSTTTTLVPIIVSLLPRAVWRVKSWPTTRLRLWKFTWFLLQGVQNWCVWTPIEGKL